MRKNFRLLEVEFTQLTGQKYELAKPEAMGGLRIDQDDIAPQNQAHRGVKPVS